MATGESSIYTRWIGRLFGIRVIVSHIGDKLPERAKIRVEGLIAYDDPSTASTVISLPEITVAQHGSLAGGALHALATTMVAGFMSAADKAKLDGLDALGYVTAVSVTAPITKSGAALSPTIGISAATTSAAGSMSAADKTKIDAANQIATPTTIAMYDASGYVNGNAFKLKTAVSVNRSAPLHWRGAIVSGAESWVPTSTGTAKQAVIASEAECYIQLDLPDKSVLTNVNFNSQGAGANPDPEYLPTYSVIRRHVETHAETVVGTNVDGSAATAQPYRDSHWTEVTCSNHTVDRVNYTYYAKLTPEYGSDSAIGLQLDSILLGLTFPVGYAVGLS
jgi:hypothetical protein